MAFEKGDRVVFHDKHSEHDGEVGEVSQVSETMFGDSTYIVEFEEGQEAGIPEDSLEPAQETGESGAGAETGESGADAEADELESPADADAEN